MKKIILFVCIALVSANSFSQKKKKAVAKKPAVTATAGFAKLDNLVAEVKGGNFQVTINENGKPKDAIIIKAADAKFVPNDCKLSVFKSNDTKLYLLSWIEKSVAKTEAKTEEITKTNSVVLEIESKKQVFSNTEVTNHITEKVSLGGTAATETQEKIRREGYQMVLNPDGSIIQKSKNQENKLFYDSMKKEYVIKK